MALSSVQAYSELYKALSLALYRPDEDLLSPGYFQTLRALVSQLGLPLAGPIEELDNFYGCQTAGLPDLEIEYSRLFVGPFSLPVPPYESCFREKGGVMGESTIAVSKFYQQTGFEVDSDLKEPPDHIAFEIDFLAELCNLENKLAEQEIDKFKAVAKERQKEFLQKHLLAWAEAFQEAVQREAALIFYPAITKIMVETAKTHFQSLNSAS